jgi:hypothetical protein
MKSVGGCATAQQAPRHGPAPTPPTCRRSPTNSTAALPFGTILILLVIWSLVTIPPPPHPTPPHPTPPHPQSTAALPFGTILILLVIWSLVTIPLTVFGGIAGKNAKTEFDAPCRWGRFGGWAPARGQRANVLGGRRPRGTSASSSGSRAAAAAASQPPKTCQPPARRPPKRTNKYPREIPLLPWYRSTLPQMAMAGFLPFSAIYVEVRGHRRGASQRPCAAAPLARRPGPFPACPPLIRLPPICLPPSLPLPPQLYYIFASVWGHKVYIM